MSGARETLVVATGHALSLARLRGRSLLAEHHADIGLGHAEALMSALDALFSGRPHRVARIIVETGPGSFTGLRVGAAAARALGLAWGCPVLGVGSAALVVAEARAAGETARILVALRAPRGQVWLQAEHEPVAVSLDPEEAARRARRWLDAGGAVTGSAAPRLVGGRARPEAHPRAAAARDLDEKALGPPRLAYVRAAPAGAARVAEPA